VAGEVDKALLRVPLELSIQAVAVAVVVVQVVLPVVRVVLVS
jgi:hypothetical protein